MTGRRNDPQHFPPINGEGHRRRKVVNQLRPHLLDRYERRTRDLVQQVFDELDLILRDDAVKRRRVRGGDPGE